MKRSSQIISALLLVSGLTAHAQTITYVDADLTNTLIDGAAPDIGVNVTSPDRPNGDNIWGYDNDSNWANPNPTDGAIWAAGSNDAVPELATTITGLTPGGTYAIYAFGWTAGTTWDMQAGLTSGDLTAFRNGPAGAYFALGDLTEDADPDPTTITTATLDGVVKTFSAPLESSEGNRDIYLCKVGTTSANASGEITVYIDDYPGGDRTWYDGVGYEEVSDLPTVSIQPDALDAILGSDATFTASADAPLPITYQWRKDAVNLAGETAATLTIAGADLDDLGDYDVVATTTAGSTTSAASPLTLTLPDVTPGAQIVIAGSDAEFSVAMPDTQTYTYQWQKDGTDIPGATGQTLVLPGVSSADNALYGVQVTLADGPLTSGTTGELVVPAVPTMSYDATIVADGPVGYWRLGESVGEFVAVDEIEPEQNYEIGEPVVLGQPGVVLGDTNTCMTFDGTEDSVLEGQSGSDEPDLNPAIFTVEFWARPTGGSGRRTAVASSDTDISLSTIKGYEVGLDGNGRWEFRTGQGDSNAWNTLTGPAAAVGAWSHVVATYDGTDMLLYVNGLPAGTLAAGTFAPQTSWPNRIGGGANEALPALQVFVGDIDEVAIYASVLTATDIQEHFVAAFDPTAPPEIAAQPADQSALIGSQATLSVSALSGSGLSYQWRRGGIDLDAETGPTITFDSLAVSDAGSYDVVVTNINGSVTSDTASLVPLTDYLGTILLPDDTNTILQLDGSSTWFDDDQTVAVDNGLWRRRTVFAILPDLTPYGYEASSNAAGVAAGDLEVQTTLSGLTPDTDYAIWTLLSDKTGLTAGIQAAFDGDPMRTITIGEMEDTGLTSVSPAGGTDPWRILHGFIGVKRSDSSGNILVNVDYALGGGRTVYNGLGYQLAIPESDPPLITVAPTDHTVPLGLDATFTVAARSATAVTYQWQKDGVDIPDATSDTLVVTNVGGADSGQYRAVVTNSEGSTESEAAYLVPIEDRVGTFVFPDSDNTILTRDGSPVFSDPDAPTAEGDGLWTESTDLGVPGEAASTHGFLATPANENGLDVEIQTTITGLDPAEAYAVWALYAFQSGSTGDRLSGALLGNPLKSYDDSELTTGLVTGATGQFNVHHGLLGVVMPNASGEIVALADFQGLTRTMLLGYGYQTSTLPPDLNLALTIESVGGIITLTWPQGTLQESSDLGNTDAWADVVGATSPYIYPGPPLKAFFRVTE